jgi:hypothetical protein
MTRLVGSDAIACLERAVRVGGGALDAALSNIGVSGPADREAVRELLRTPDVKLRADVNRHGEDVIWLVPGASNGIHRVGLVDSDGRVRHVTVVAP